MKKLINKIMKTLTPMGGVAVIGIVTAIIVITAMVLEEKYYKAPPHGNIFTEQAR